MPRINLNGSTYNKTSGPALYESMQPNGTPWPSVTAAHNAAIYKGISHVRIIDTGSGIKEYWYVGGVAEVNLVLKSPPGGSSPFVTSIGAGSIVAAGASNSAVGTNAFVANSGNSANGEYAAAFGLENNALGNNSFATGFQTVTNGENAFTSGLEANATGAQSAAFGKTTAATGAQSIATGNQTSATGENAFSQGNATTAEGFNSFAAGDTNNASGDNAAAFGLNNSVQSLNSAAFGTGHFVENPNMLVAGRFSANPNGLFVVGNGNDDADRSNAFEVKADGTIVTGNAWSPFRVEDVVSGAAGTATHYLNIAINGTKYRIALTPN